MTTARDIISDAFKKIHVLGRGQSLDPDEANDALTTLNDILALLSVDGCGTYQEIQETFSFMGGQNVYTIGSGQDFDTTIPVDITAAYATVGDTDYNLTKIGETRYASFADKDEVTTSPTYFYFDGNYPVAKIYFVGAPSTGTVTLFSRKPLTSFDTLDTVFAMPAQYKTLLVHELAVYVAPYFEREASATVRRIADEAKRIVKSQNKKNNPMFSRIDDIPDRQNVSGDIYRGFF